MKKYLCKCSNEFETIRFEYNKNQILGFECNNCNFSYSFNFDLDYAEFIFIYNGSKFSSIDLKICFSDAYNWHDKFVKDKNFPELMFKYIDNMEFI